MSARAPLRFTFALVVASIALEFELKQRMSMKSP